MKKKSPTLAPPFKVKRSTLQGHQVIKVTKSEGSLLVKREKPSDEKSDGFDDYERTKVYNSWET